MRITLNKKQKEYLLDTFYEDGYEIWKAYETADRDWIISKRITIADTDDFIPGWPTILVDGKPTTAINAEYMPKQWRKLLSLGAK